MISEDITRAIVKVGEGRGFVVQGRTRYVITAAHCLPFQPLPHPGSYTQERTYEALLGPIEGEQRVSAECLFVDPVADLAVLGSPDNQAMFDEAQLYVEWVETLPALRVSDLPPPTIPPTTEQEWREIRLPLERCFGSGTAWLISLDCRLISELDPICGTTGH
jgi:hypothetical protein